MSRKTASAARHVAPEGASEHQAGSPNPKDPKVLQFGEGQEGSGAESPESGAPEGSEPSAPPRLNGEVQPTVDSAASTITGCSEAEIKNYLATTDFVIRQIALQLANRWKEICRTADANGRDGESPAKVGVSVKIDIDQTNLLLMDTKVKLGFARKYSESAETQEDLRQVEFKLSST